jgi:hypothetical protein
LAAVIPNLFTRIDLWAMLLPGYVTLILTLVLFYPSSLNIGADATFNLFAAIVFIVASPAIGFTLTQFSNVIVHTVWDPVRYDFLREYSQIRLNNKDNDTDNKNNSEFDNIDARITFSRSTGLGLVIIGFFLMVWQQPFSSAPLNPLFNLDDINFRFITAIVIYAVGVFLIVGATFETVNVRDVLICREIYSNEKGKAELEKSIKDKCETLMDHDKRHKHTSETLGRILLVAILGSIAMILVYVYYTVDYKTQSLSEKYLGFSADEITSYSERSTLPPTLTGVIVNTIKPNSSADKAQIIGSTTDHYGQNHVGDIITAIDGKPIISTEDLISYLEQNKSPGNNITLTIYRNGETLNTTVNIK